MSRSSDDVPLPKVVGDNAPKGSNINEVRIYKGYFCKFMCQHDWDNFNELQVFTNDEFKTHARAIYNDETERVFMENIFDSDAEFQKMTRFVIETLVNLGLLTKRLESDGSTYTYYKTSKLKELCPKIMEVGLPSIDFLVDKHDSRI
jgi:hypothetical protein